MKIKYESVTGEITEVEVSEEIGISHAQVSRLEKFALKKIKN